MRKIILLSFTILILLVSSVSAMRTCQEIQEKNIACEVITPVIDCATYDLYNSTFSLKINDGTMTQLGSTGMYNFTFNQSDTGTHTILLCDNSTTVIEVADYSSKGIFDKTITVSVNTSAIADAVWDENLTDHQDTDSSGLKLYSFVLSVADIWKFMIGYVNPSGTSLNASETLKTIAENTEAGGWS